MSGDCLYNELQLPTPKLGDIVLVHDTGANDYSMASSFKSRLHPIEILVDGGEYRLVRE